jgi:membrane-bound lytic murein transglycosylase D
MFIASTARAYGLRVNDQVDQHMNEALLTDAAMRYLLANRFRFSDWQLSLLAYNVGENAVQQAINETGSRDPWVLVRNSGLSAESRNYLPKVMAAILIMKNPSSVE